MWSVRKKIYYVFYLITAKWLPESRHMRIAKKLRGFWTKRIISYMGFNVNIERGARFTPELKIGNNSGIGISSEINGPVIIGNDVMMGPEVVIYTSGHKYEKLDIPMREQGSTEVRPVIIEDDVWIGRRAIIMPGIVVGKGAIIGAGAVVTKNVSQYSIVGGVPARVLKSRIYAGGVLNKLVNNLEKKLRHIYFNNCYFRMEVAE